MDEIAGVLFPRAAHVLLTAPRTARALSARRLAELTGHHAAEVRVVPDAEAALERALASAAPEDAVFLTGSLYLVGQIRQFWKNRADVAVR